MNYADLMMTVEEVDEALHLSNEELRITEEERRLIEQRIIDLNNRRRQLVAVAAAGGVSGDAADA